MSDSITNGGVCCYNFFVYCVHIYFTWEFSILNQHIILQGLSRNDVTAWVKNEVKDENGKYKKKKVGWNARRRGKEPRQQKQK